MSSPSLIVFGPSSPQESELHKDLHRALVSKGWRYTFVTPKRYMLSDGMHDYGYRFQEYIDTDCFLTGPGKPFLNKHNSNEYSKLALQWIRNKPRGLRYLGLYGQDWVSSEIHRAIEKHKPTFALTWGDHRPFSLLALDIVENLSIKHARIDRAFVPNSYKLFSSCNPTTIAIGDPADDPKRYCSDLKLMAASGQYIYKENACNDVPAEPYVLFLGVSDLDVGIYRASRFKASVMSAYKTSLHAYHDICRFLKRNHKISCFYRPHPFSPSRDQQNIHCSLDEAIKNASFVVGTPTSALIRAHMMGKKVICIGKLENSEYLPFPQVDTRDDLHNLVSQLAGDTITGSAPDFDTLSIYASNCLFGFPSSLNNNMPLSITPLVSYLEEMIRC